MRIEFPPISVSDPSNWGVSFPVVVDGVQQACLITDEAIQDMFGVLTNDAATLKATFEANRNHVEGLVREKLAGGARGKIVIG